MSFDMFGNDLTKTDSFGNPTYAALSPFERVVDQTKDRGYPPALGIPPEQVAKDWERWCGETPWSVALRRFGEVGGKVIWWGGYPRSKSAIPLCFVLYDAGGRELTWEHNRSRLKDIRAGIEHMLA